jgi:hypothetical protein
VNRAEELWNEGSYTEAVALVEKIERETGNIGVIVTCQDPVATEQQRWGDDVKVNDSGIDFRKAELVRADNGNLFVVARGDTSVEYRWCLFMSSDGGNTWSRRSTYHNSLPIYDVDIAEKPGHVYVGYAAENWPTTARIQRYTNNGSYDTGFGSVAAFQTTGDIKEVELEPRLSNYQFLYYAAIDDAGDLYVYTADTSDDPSWSSMSANITNADRGLDMDYGYFGGSGSNRYCWLSYISDEDSLCVIASTSSFWSQNFNLAAVNAGTYHTTAVAAHGDTTIVFIIETDNTIGYEITYDGGSVWNHGGSIIYTGIASSADVTARGNDGFHLCFRGFYVSGDVIYYSQRGYVGGWSTLQFFNEYDPYSQYQTSIEYLGSANAYGIVYIDDNNDIYFDRTDWTSVQEHMDDAASSYIVSLTPNPSSGVAKLMYTIQSSGSVRISIYDAAGRVVKNLVNEVKPAGTHTITVDNAHLSAGIYFIRIETADGSTEKKMMIIR